MKYCILFASIQLNLRVGRRFFALCQSFDEAVLCLWFDGLVAGFTDQWRPGLDQMQTFLGVDPDDSASSVNQDNNQQPIAPNCDKIQDPDHQSPEDPSLSY